MQPCPPDNVLKTNKWQFLRPFYPCTKAANIAKNEWVQCKAILSLESKIRFKGADSWNTSNCQNDCSESKICNKPNKKQTKKKETQKREVPIKNANKNANSFKLKNSSKTSKYQKQKQKQRIKNKQNNKKIVTKKKTYPAEMQNILFVSQKPI